MKALAPDSALQLALVEELAKADLPGVNIRAADLIKAAGVGAAEQAVRRVPQVQQAAAAGGGGGWACGACTFVNRMEAGKCEACETPRAGMVRPSFSSFYVYI